MMNKIDLYSTHIEPLNKIFSTLGSINFSLEFGMGDYSTDFLIKNSKNLMSVEMQSEDWYNKMKSRFSGVTSWYPHLCLGPHSFLNLDYPHTIDFCFVDGHGDSRPDCINFAVSKNCPVIVAHDTEEPGYNWDRVKCDKYFVITFKDYQNWTTLWTTNINLYNSLNQ